MKQIEIPYFLSHLPTFKGYPVPFFVLYVDGIPDFRILDGAKQMLCIEKRLCSICGKKLDKKMCFTISGPVGVANRVCTDPPMHRNCAEYSMQTCPHLYFYKAKRNERGDLIKALQENNGLIQAEKANEMQKPLELYLVRITSYKIEINPNAPGKIFRYKFDLCEEYKYKDGQLICTGEKSKELR